LLEGSAKVSVVGEAANGRQAVDISLQLEPQLVLMDVAMPGLNGIEAARQIRSAQPNVRVLMLSMHDNEQYFFEALKAGASGYVLKTAANRDLVEACRACMRGEAFLYPPAVATLVRDYLDGARLGEAPPEDPLTARELEVVKLIAEGNTTEEIATELVLSKKTVERHRANILDKLGMRNRVDLTRYAIRRGLVEP